MQIITNCKNSRTFTGVFIFRMMQKLIPVLFVLFLSACFPPFSKEHGKIEGATEITLELNRLTDTTSGIRTYSVTDPAMVQKLLDEINNAPETGPMKGAGWHKLTIWKGDAIWEFSTDGEVFGRNTSMFYKFRSKNILKEYFHIDTH
jgi:hypothetical protein